MTENPFAGNDIRQIWADTVNKNDNTANNIWTSSTIFVEQRPIEGQEPMPNPGLYAPRPDAPTPNYTERSTADIVKQLMNPPEHLVHIDGRSYILTKAWAISIIGPNRFESRDATPCHRLLVTDPVNIDGVQKYGLCERIRSWLIGANDKLDIDGKVFSPGRSGIP
ncbi:Nn.00g005520.m01.CDS01 [Neocucurbitaria sp. VM-36]